MMGRRVLGVLVVLALGAVKAEAALVAVEVWPDVDGWVWVGVEGLPHESDARRVERALGEIFDSSRASFDLNRSPDDTWWVVVHAPGYLPHRGWTRQGTFDLEPLRRELAHSGIGEVAVTFALPAAPVGSAAPALAFDDEVDWGHHFTGTFSTSENWTPITIEYGYSAASGLARLVLLAVVSLLTVCASVVLSRVMWRRLADGDDGAYFVAGQAFGGILAVHWLFWMPFTLVASPFEPLAYPFAWVYDHEWALQTFALPLAGVAAPILGRQFLYPVFARYPGARWTRADFVRQSVYTNLGIAALLIAIVPAIDALFEGHLLRALGIAVCGAALHFFCRVRTLSAMGYQPQALDEGALRERIDELTEKAGIPKIKSVHVVHMTSFPMSNAFSASGMRIMFTDYLLNHLSKREVDAIVAHELGHLKRGHLKKIVVFWFGVAFASFAISMALTLLMASLPEWTGLRADAFRQLWLLGIVLGVTPLSVLAYMALRRRFEYQADASGLAINGDGEAAISSLSKVTRFNLTPSDSRGLGGYFMTHPPTRARCAKLAAEAGVSDDRMNMLMSGEDAPPEERYSIPASSASGRVFSSNHKSRVSLTVLASAFALAALGPLAAAAAQAYGAIPGVPPLGWAGMGFAGSVLALLLFERISGATGFGAVARRLAPLRIPPGEDPGGYTFVSFIPSGEKTVYEGFLCWDVGFARIRDEGLEYRGDGAQFQLPKAWIEGVGLVDVGTRAMSDVRLAIDWIDASETKRRFLLKAMGSRWMPQCNRLTRVFAERLDAWLASPPGEQAPPEDLSPPGTLEAKGIPWAEAVSGRGIARMGLFAGICAAVLAEVVGPSNVEVWSQSPIYAGGAAGAAFIAYGLLVKGRNR